MEDTLIVPTYFAYSIRVDKKTNLDYIASNKKYSLLEEFKTFYDRLCPKSRYLCYIEQSTVVKKEHIQGIIWTPQQLLPKELTAHRQWWKRPSGGISLCSAKKVKNLASYVAKDKGENITNLSSEQLQLVPEWKPHAKQWKHKLNKKLKELVSETNGLNDYTWSVVKFYLSNSKAPPNRATLYKHLLNNHPQFTPMDYISAINLFPQSNYQNV